MGWGWRGRMELEVMAQPPRQGQAQHPSSPAADVTRARRRLSEEGLLRSSPLLAADALPDPQPSSRSPCCPPIASRHPPVALVADLPGILRIQSWGRGCRAMARRWPWSWRGRGPLGSVAWMYFASLWWAEQLPWPWRKFRAALLGGLGICMIKDKSRGSLGPFYFPFSRPDVLRAEMLGMLLASAGRSSLNPWLQKQAAAGSDWDLNSS